MSIYDLASLVLIPSGTKTSKVYSQKPTNGDGDFTFSRSTAATRVNASGNIEKETENLLTYSNTFSNAAWVKLGAGSGTAASVTSGFNDPDGGSNAWRLQCDLNGGSLTTDQSLIYQAGSLTGVFAFSYYVKSNTGASQDFAFGNSLNGYKLATATTSWQRFTTFHNCTSNNNSFIGARGGLNTDDTLDILIYAAQLEQGLVARDYIETTTTAIYGGITDNVPRLDYQGSCPALLLEPQRSNNISQSEYHQGAIAAVTRTYNTADTLSPEGYYNAVKYEVNANNSDPYLRVFNIPTSGNDATFSLYVKGASGQLFSMILGRDGYNELAYEAFTLDGTWQRLTLSKTFTTTPTTLTIGAEFSHSSDDGVLGQEYYLYGLQCEAGSYATSYIPTYGSAVTRNEDVFKVSDVGTNNLITNDAFTLFVDIASVQDSVNSFRDLVAIFGSKNFRIETRTNGQVRAQQIGMVTSGDDFNSVTIGTYSNTKFAFTFTTTQCKIYVDGALHSTYNGAYTHDFNVLSVRNSSSLGAELKNEYRKVMLFPTALSEQEAIDLTTI